MNKGFSKAAILSIALTVCGVAWTALPVTSMAVAQDTQANVAITLELFDQQPTDSSTPLSVADLSGGGDLGDLMAADNAAQARFLRVTVVQNDKTDTRLYRVLVTPSNGRVFILSPQGVISLDNLLRQSGLQVEKDNLGVTPGTGAVELKVDGLSNSTSDASTDTSISSTPAATSPDTSATTTTTATPPADSSATTAAAAPTDTSAATPAATTTAPADTSTASAGSAQPLTAAVNQDLGKLALSVLPTSATAPASSETNFYVLPYTDATSPTQGISDNVVTLDYATAASLTDVAAYYDKLMTDQGFTKVTDDTMNSTSDTQIVQVYKRGEAMIALTIDRGADGKYTVTVDLNDLVERLGT